VHQAEPPALHPSALLPRGSLPGIRHNCAHLQLEAVGTFKVILPACTQCWAIGLEGLICLQQERVTFSTLCQKLAFQPTHHTPVLLSKSSFVDLTL
jgi:hypothetical protein